MVPVSGCWETNHDFSLAHCISSLLFNYLSSYGDLLRKISHRQLNANFSFHYQHTESALSEILESASVH